MKKQNANRKRLRRLAVALTASAVAAASPMTAFAAKNSPNDQSYQPPEAPAPDYKKEMTPEFAYSEDKWAALRDNVMEYEELADLIHEYNPTVRSNRYTYNDQRDHQGLTDVYNELMDDAWDAWDDADDYDTETYAERLAGAQLDFAGNSLAKLADNNYMDAEMYKIQYDQTEANLVYQAQQLMVAHQKSDYALRDLEASRDMAQMNYEAVQAQHAVGMATDVDVLTAEKSVQDIDTSTLTAQKTIDNNHRTLCLMLGWGADADPDIRPVPEADLSRIAGMDPVADREEALANNYDIKYYQRKLENVTTNELKTSAQASIDDARNSVENGLNTQYNAVLDARDTLDSANVKYQLETANMNTVNARAATGNAGKLEVVQQQAAFIQAEDAVETAKLDLLLAMEKYDWIKKGLTF